MKNTEKNYKTVFSEIIKNRKEKKMKVGIMTFWWSDDNYGQLLQCYALQKYLQNIGHDPYLIRYKWYSDVRKNPLPIRILKALNPAFMFKYLKKKKNKAKIKIEVANNPRYFDDFRKRYEDLMKAVEASKDITDVRGGSWWQGLWSTKSDAKADLGEMQKRVIEDLQNDKMKNITITGAVTTVLNGKKEVLLLHLPSMGMAKSFLLIIIPLTRVLNNP